MSDYRAESSSLVIGPFQLERGFFGGGHYDVPIGHVAVITASGKVMDTYSPGRSRLRDLPRNAMLEAYLVDTRTQVIDFRSNGEHSIQEFDINQNKRRANVKLHITVKFCVKEANARFVVENHLNPFDEVRAEINNAIRKTIQFQSFEEFVTDGADLAACVQYVLDQRDIETNTGVTILGITPQSFQPADRKSAMTIEEATVRQPLDIRWWVLNRPDTISMLIEKHADFLLSVGTDPANVLEQLSSVENNPLINAILGKELTSLQGPDATPSPLPPPPLEIASAPTQPLSPVSPERIDEEWTKLEANGWKIDGRSVLKGERAVPDGSFEFQVDTTLRDGQALRVLLHLPVGYEQSVLPNRAVYLQDERIEFPAVDPVKWRAGQTLSDLVSEVIAYYQ